MKKILALACAATIGVTSFTACDFNLFKKNEGTAKNIILLIGDGMGENHIQNALTYFELTEPRFMADRQGSIATKSKNNAVTDSAAAGTALATGQKVNNGEIAYHNGKNIQTIAELAKKAGKKVGIVTTDTLDGATPSAFSAHAKDRDDSDDIVSCQLATGFDLFIGEMDDGFYNNYEAAFESKGYSFASSPEEMVSYASSDKLIATLPNVRSNYREDTKYDYQLKDIVAFATEFLDNENGYFLMVESAHIDKYSHNNEIVNALCEVRSFFDTMDYLYDTVSEDTAIILTADHETGRLSLAKSKAEVDNYLYNSSGHTGVDVPIFMKNVPYTLTGTVQNTEVFEICKKLFGLT
ncbi:MAG: alkaline phosphatase [Clostridia bacterium]|nr:alkaline phosphatase [Clostridia bacterium]